MATPAVAVDYCPTQPLGVLVGWVVLATWAFACSFAAAWDFMGRRAATSAFHRLSLAHKAEFMSRWNSTVHGCVIVPLLAYYVVAGEFDPATFEPVRSSQVNEVPWLAMQCGFTIMAGYFIFDGIVTWYFRIPDWAPLLVHHFFALAPLAVLLGGACTLGSRITACYMLVEVSNICQNVKDFIAFAIGTSKTHCSRLYSVALYVTLASWIASRVCLLPWVMLQIHTRLLPLLSDEQWMRMVVPFTASWFGVAFSAYCFVFIVLKEVAADLRRRFEGSDCHVEASADLRARTIKLAR